MYLRRDVPVSRAICTAPFELACDGRLWPLAGLRWHSLMLFIIKQGLGELTGSAVRVPRWREKGNPSVPVGALWQRAAAVL